MRNFKSPYLFTVLSLYLNFFVHGIGVIIIAQNMSFLMHRFGTDEAGIAAGLISGMGLGRFISYFFVGFLSDRFGRKPMIYLGCFFYLIFFAGILYFQSMQFAFVCAIFGGIANACLDSGTYPAVMEAYPQATGSSVIGCKAAISFGQMFFPLFMGYLIVEKLWFGYAFLLPMAILLVNIVLIRMLPFPPYTSYLRKTDNEVMKNDPPVLLMKSKPKPWLEGGITVLFGYLAYAIFFIAVIWMPRYAQLFAGMDEVASLTTVTFYSIGSILSVFTLMLLLRKCVRPILIIVTSPVISCAILLLIYFYPSPLMCKVGAFIVGFAAAGGVLQLGISVLSDFFPTSKAMMTSAYMLFGSLANFTVPLITGALARINMKYIMLFNAGVAGVCVVIGIVLFYRYYKIFQIPKDDLRFGEKYCVW